jgi:ferric-dicitrate binding protein FerR (iron transport regulator)
MNRLDELIIKWGDASLSDAQCRELNSLLTAPEARARLAKEFQFDVLAREALRQQSAVAAAHTTADAFSTIDLKVPRIGVREFRWPELLRNFSRSFVLRTAFAIAVVVLATWLVLRPDPSAMVLSADSRGVTVERHNKTLSQVAGGFVLKAGDRLSVADSGAAELGNKAQSVIAEFTSPAVFVLRSPTEFLIERGEVSVAASGEIPLRVHAGRTVAITDNGAFRISVGADAVRLEVESGEVAWQRLDDGRALTVAGGFFAIAGTDQPFAPDSLVPRPWLVQDVGEVTAPVTARFEGDTVRMASGPRGPRGKFARLSGAADGSGGGRGRGRYRGSGEGFHFVYRELRGDGEIRARVLPQTGATGVEAGLVIRRDLTDGAPTTFIGNAPGRAPEMRRGFRGGRNIASADGDSERRGVPYWVRLVRQGNTVTAYRSSDGQQWAETGSDTVDLAETAFAGLAAAALADNPGGSVAFDNIKVTAAR